MTVSALRALYFGRPSSRRRTERRSAPGAAGCRASGTRRRSLQERELMLGRLVFLRLELSEQLDGVGAAALDLVHAPARLERAPAGRHACSFRRRTSRRGSARRSPAGSRSWRPSSSSRSSRPRAGRCIAAPAPGPARSWLRRSRRRSARGPRPFFLRLSFIMRDHGTVLVGGHHRQRAVRVADPLQPAELAGREVEAEQASDTGGGGH